MTTEALVLLPGFGLARSSQEVFTPHQLRRMSGFTPSMFWYVPSGIIPIEDCRVFMMLRRVTSHLIRPILSHQVNPSYNYTSQSSIRLYKLCGHSCIHTFMHIQHTDNIIHTWLH